MNEQIIWNYLLAKTSNSYGTAAIMGNLMAESSLNPACCTGKNKSSNYVSDVDDGTIDFVHDGVAFGLVQWCYYSRKEGFYNFVKSRGKSVGDLNVQLEYLVQEMSTSYKTVWAAVINATNIREASDVVMLKYEKPAGTSETAKQKRADYGQKFYNKYAADQSVEKKSNKEVQITINKVNVRTGNGKEYGKIGQVNKGCIYTWVATSENNWHAIVYNKQVAWVSGEYSNVV